MARPLVSDELWELIEPLIPKVKRRYRYPGRRRIDERKVLTGHPVRTAHGHPVGVPAAGDGLRVGDDLLAAAEGVAGGRRLAAAARVAACETPQGRGDRLVTGGNRQLHTCGRLGGEKTGPVRSTARDAAPSTT
jgi:hypothetical protein